MNLSNLLNNSNIQILLLIVLILIIFNLYSKKCNIEKFSIGGQPRMHCNAWQFGSYGTACDQYGGFDTSKNTISVDVNNINDCCIRHTRMPCSSWKLGDYITACDQYGGFDTSKDTISVEVNNISDCCIQPPQMPCSTWAQYAQSNYCSELGKEYIPNKNDSVAFSEIDQCCRDVGQPTVSGCMDRTATNYNSLATTDDGSCTMPLGGGGVPAPAVDPIPGCMDPAATNYNKQATTDDSSCTMPCRTWAITLSTECSDLGKEYIENNDASVTFREIDQCCEDVGQPTVSGCTNPNATNYNPLANSDDSSCTMPLGGGGVPGPTPTPTPTPGPTQSPTQTPAMCSTFSCPNPYIRKVNPETIPMRVTDRYSDNVILCCDHVISSDVDTDWSGDRVCTNGDLGDFEKAWNIQGCSGMVSDSMDMGDECNFSCNDGSSRRSSDGLNLEYPGITPDNGKARCTENGLVIDVDFTYPLRTPCQKDCVAGNDFGDRVFSHCKYNNIGPYTPADYGNDAIIPTGGECQVSCAEGKLPKMIDLAQSEHVDDGDDDDNDESTIDKVNVFCSNGVPYNIDDLLARGGPEFRYTCCDICGIELDPMEIVELNQGHGRPQGLVGVDLQVQAEFLPFCQCIDLDDWAGLIEVAGLVAFVIGVEGAIEIFTRTSWAQSQRSEQTSGRARDSIRLAPPPQPPPPVAPPLPGPSCAGTFQSPAASDQCSEQSAWTDGDQDVAATCTGINAACTYAAGGPPGPSDNPDYSCIENDNNTYSCVSASNDDRIGVYDASNCDNECNDYNNFIFYNMFQTHYTIFQDELSELSDDDKDERRQSANDRLGRRSEARRRIGSTCFDKLISEQCPIDKELIHNNINDLKSIRADYYTFVDNCCKDILSTTIVEEPRNQCYNVRCEVGTRLIHEAGTIPAGHDPQDYCCEPAPPAPVAQAPAPRPLSQECQRCLMYEDPTMGGGGDYSNCDELCQ